VQGSVVLCAQAWTSKDSQTEKRNAKQAGQMIHPIPEETLKKKN
jgi:hypothetical protein